MNGAGSTEAWRSEIAASGESGPAGRIRYVQRPFSRDMLFLRWLIYDTRDDTSSRLTSDIVEQM